jgi:diguanylate cyclase (GGDEF)-like protein
MDEVEQATSAVGTKYDPILAARLSDFLKLSAVLLRSHNSKLITELIATAVGDLMLTAVFSGFYQPHNTNHPFIAIARGKRMSASETAQLLLRLPLLTDHLESPGKPNCLPLDFVLQQELQASQLYIVPVRTPTQYFGLIMVGVNYQIEPIQANFLVALADLAAIALESAEGFDLLQQAVTENRLVNEIATALAGSLNPQELFEVFIQKLQPLLEFKWASLSLLDSTQTHCEVLFNWSYIVGRVRRAHSNQADVKESPLSLLLTSQDMVAGNTHQPELAVVFDHAIVGEIKAYLLIPLVNKGRIVGSLNLATSHSAAYADFDNLPLALLEKLVSHLALALSNSLLYEEQQISAETDNRLGIYNHDYFDRQIKLQLKEAAHQHYRLGLLMIDMDNLKTINDHYGHPAGDAALRHIAKLITAAVRSIDIVARYGGDEFTVLLVGCSSEGLAAVSEKIRQDIRDTPLVLNNNTEIQLSVSIGGAIYPDHAHTSVELLSKADAAMYIAKKQRNQVWLTPKTHQHRSAKGLHRIEPLSGVIPKPNEAGLADKVS